GGESIYEGPFADEFTIEYLPYRGALCMANSGANTNGSQFFVVQSGTDQVIDEYVTQFEDAELPQGIIDNYKTYGGTPWLFYVHTTFGQVYEGMDVVDAIAAVAVDDNAMPAEPVIIESAEVITYD
nr:peptidylprolyl isomerase [Vallitaleaceae bacterium]